MPEERPICPVCQTTHTTSFVSIPQVPIHCNVLLTTRDEALSVPKGDIQLAFCAHCGHIFNHLFDPAQMTYTQDYENSLHFSPRFQEYAAALAEHLLTRYDLRNKDIIEIGAGKGDFLKMLCTLGANRGIGFDPSYVPGAEDNREETAVSFIQDFYSEQYAHYQADLILSRHVLEHIQHPISFLTTVRRAIGSRTNTLVFFEVPNALFTLQQLGIWDIIYEHCSYFTPASLAYAFRQTGFAVLDVHDTFNGQFLTIAAQPETDRQAITPTPTHLRQDVAAFGENYRQKVTFWQQRLRDWAQQQKRIIIWGTGSKGVTFLNALPTRHTIPYAVDINPRKQGKFVAGSGQEIVSPDFLTTNPPDIVIIMNANYRAEIGQTLQTLGITAEIFIA